MNLEKALLVLSIVLYGTPVAIEAGELPLTAFPGQRFVFDFEIPAVPPNTTDVFRNGPSSATSGGVTNVEIAIYDGNQLLGSTTGMGSFFSIFGGFVSADSVRVGAPGAQVIDFGSILDASIQGRLVITPNFSRPNNAALTYREFTLITGQTSTGAGIFTSTLRDVIIRDVRVVPEPATAMLICSSGFSFAFGKRRRRAE